MAVKVDVIFHPEEQPIAIIRMDYVTICEGNQCAAAILNLFEYWTGIKKESNKQAVIKNKIDTSDGNPATQDTELWIYKSQREMREELVQTWSETVIASATKYLIKKGYLQSRSNPNNRWDQTLQYLFIIEAVQKAVDKAYPAFRKSTESKAQKHGIDRSKTRNRVRNSKKSNPQIYASNTKDHKTKTTTKATAETTPPPPTPALAELEPPTSATANGGGGEKSELTPIEMLLSENGVNAHSWKFAEGWTLEQVQVITDRAKEPGINRPAAWIVSQLQMPSARVMAQVELDTRHNQPADELTGQEATGVTSFAIPAFEPIVDGWQKDTPAPETWQHGVLNNLQAQLHSATFNSWLKGSRLLAYEGKQQPPTLTVVAHSQNAKEWLEGRLIGTVEGITRQLFGDVTLQIIAPSEIDATLAAIRVRVEGIPPAPHQLIPGDMFTPGSGWIQRRDGDEQHEETTDLPAPAPQPKGDDGQKTALPEKPDPASLSPAVIWSKIKSGLRFTDLNRDQFETYFKTAELIGYLGDEIFVKVGGHTVREVRTNLRSKVLGRIEKVTGGCWRIRLVDRDEADRLPENLIKLQEAV